MHSLPWNARGRVALAVLILGIMFAGVQPAPAFAAAATYNVRDFGAIANDDIDDTDAFRAALTAARRAGGGTIRVPGGRFMIRASAPSPSNSIRVYAGLKVIGAGKTKTTLKMIGSSVDPSWPAIRMVVLESNTTFRDLTVDGNRQAVDRSQNKDVASFMVSTTQKSSGQLIENVRVRNAYSEGREGFGISIGETVNATIRNVESINNDGTGIAVHGEIYSAYGWWSENITVENAIVRFNGRQGISVYGARSSTLTNITANSNKMNGINLEWSRDMAIRNSLSHDNKYRGFNTFGVNWNVHVESLTTRNNGAYYKHGGEIGILNGYWGPTNNIKNPATGIVERGLTQDITFLNCSFTPAAGKWHMYVQTDVAGVTLGTVFPSKMLMYNSGAQDWRFRIDWNNKITRPQLEPYVLSTYGVNVVTS